MWMFGSKENWTESEKKFGPPARIRWDVGEDSSMKEEERGSRKKRMGKKMGENSGR